MATNTLLPPIWTLQARDSVMLEVVASMGNFSDAEMQREILGAHRLAVDMLDRKDVDYRTLRSALVPQQKRYELAFVFDSAQIAESWYGREAAKRLIDALPPALSCCILNGDLIIEDQDVGFTLIEEFLTPTRNSSISHTTQLYCLYVNNLSAKMYVDIVNSLREYPPFIGFVDASNSSRMKDWLSTTLVPACLKTKRTVIYGHEDDADKDTDYDMLGWPWEEAGFKIRSFPHLYWHLFLAYKIERRVVPGFESDARFALAAIAGKSTDLSQIEVVVDAAKANYLREAHPEGLERAGLLDADNNDLAEIAKAKIADSYFYKLEIDPRDGACKFNTMFELVNPTNEKVTRVVGAFKFEPGHDRIRLITLH